MASFNSPKGSAGFGYVGVLMLMVVIGVAAAASVQVGSLIDQREREAELLYVGSQFRAALQSYYEATPVGQRRYPSRLEDLLKDPRYPGVKRHLRRIYIDPISGKAEWGTVAAAEGGILGVHSLSPAKPIKIASFEPDFAAFEGKTKYAEWVFAYAPQAVVPALAPAVREP